MPALRPVDANSAAPRRAMVPALREKAAPMRSWSVSTNIRPPLSACPQILPAARTFPAHQFWLRDGEAVPLERLQRGRVRAFDDEDPRSAVTILSGRASALAVNFSHVRGASLLVVVHADQHRRSTDGRHAKRDVSCAG